MELRMKKRNTDVSNNEFLETDREMPKTTNSNLKIQYIPVKSRGNLNKEHLWRI